MIDLHKTFTSPVTIASVDVLRWRGQHKGVELAFFGGETDVVLRERPLVLSLTTLPHLHRAFTEGLPRACAIDSYTVDS